MCLHFDKCQCVSEASFTCVLHYINAVEISHGGGMLDGSPSPSRSSAQDLVAFFPPKLLNCPPTVQQHRRFLKIRHKSLLNEKHELETSPTIHTSLIMTLMKTFHGLRIFLQPVGGFESTLKT